MIKDSVAEPTLNEITGETVKVPAIAVVIAVVEPLANVVVTLTE